MADEKNYFAMSDDDMANEMPPEPVEAEEVVVPEAGEGGVQTVETVEEVEEIEEADEKVLGADDETKTPPVETPDPEKPDGDAPDPDAVVTDPTKSPAAPAAKGDESGKVITADEAGKDPPVSKEKGVETPADTQIQKKEPTAEEQKSFYDMLLANPIKANGKDIQLESPEEVLKLVQMGANYTKKMQQLHPSLRLVKMLDNNGLLDEKKLAHLIDLDKGNPQAIQKFLADKKFDPHTVDEQEAAKYVPGDHQVSDAQIRFSNALDDLESTPAGKELIGIISSQWDGESKRAAYEEPSILQKIQDHRESGLYGQIEAEMNRQSALGKLDGVPWLQAYQATGEMLAKLGKLKQPEPVKQPAVAIESRTVVKQPAKLPNTDKAQAAAATKAAASKIPSQTNYLELSDEEFLKQTRDRM